MLFNSFSFALFLPVVLLLYYGIGYQKIKWQNLLLLCASYLFYGLWDWRFLSLIIVSSLIDYIAGIQINKTNFKSKRRFWLYFSLFWNLGILFYFKYCNFFIFEFSNLFNLDSNGYIYQNLDIILPVGLSFYTFQTLSYTIDVYRNRIKATNNLLNFLCFVSFFPQLVAGPIERATSLLPQFSKKRKFNIELSKDGLRQIMWGLFKKMIIADNLAFAVNAIYESPQDHGSSSLLYASALFFFQIYCDFSGYSDIAIGTAKLFGFKLTKNFNIPYLSRSVSEFWQRWHITLTRWFTDYVYGTLIKNWKRSSIAKVFALFITMGLIGLWHGANWTFIVFGLFQALMISLERIPISVKGRSRNFLYYLSKMPLGLTIVYSFTLILISCIFFRSESLTMAGTILRRIVSFLPSDNFSFEIGWRIFFLPLLIVIEYITRTKEHPFKHFEKKFSRPTRWVIYYIFIFIIFRYAGPTEAFIYFQF